MDQKVDRFQKKVLIKKRKQIVNEGIKHSCSRKKKIKENLGEVLDPVKESLLIRKVVKMNHQRTKEIKKFWYRKPLIFG